MFSISSKIKPERVPGKECVWDYPRPAICESTPRRIRVILNGVTIADSVNAYRVLETSHPPTYYIPPQDCQMEYFTKNSHSSFCEWKGQCSYVDINVNGKKVVNAGWFYENPTTNFQPMKNYLAFYANKMDACYVDDEKVNAQEGSFYGGWITSHVTGPFKGGAGTYGW